MVDPLSEAYIRSSEKAFLKHVPDLRTYENASIEELPFLEITSASESRYIVWKTPKHEITGMDAFQLGNEYAAHLAQFLKDNSHDIRTSMFLLREIMKSGAGQNGPCFEGFCQYLQETITERVKSIDLHKNTAYRHENFLKQRKAFARASRK